MRSRWVAALVLAVAFMTGSVVSAGADPPLITGEQVADDSLTGADIVESTLILGYERQQATVPVESNSSPTFASVACSQGKRPLGGGFEFRPETGAAYGDVTVRLNAPTPNSWQQGEGWLVIVEPLGSGATGLSIRVFVICAAI